MSKQNKQIIKCKKHGVVHKNGGYPSCTKVEKKVKRKPFHNRYGYIKLGTPVSFEVENQNMWMGDLRGILEYENGKYVIKTLRSGTLRIDEYLSVYSNTIRPII